MTIKKIHLLFPVLMIGGCRNQSSEKLSPPAADSMTVLNRDSATKVNVDGHYLWEAYLDPKEGLIVKRTTPANPDSMTVSLTLARLNGYYPEIPLRLQKLSNDTLYLGIKDSRYLTMQMGSSGPEAYMAEVVYNLTEIAPIHYVTFGFKQHDHGAAGTYSRTDFTMR